MIQVQRCNAHFIVANVINNTTCRSKLHCVGPTNEFKNQGKTKWKLFLRTALRGGTYFPDHKQWCYFTPKWLGRRNAKLSRQAQSLQHRRNFNFYGLETVCAHTATEVRNRDCRQPYHLILVLNDLGHYWEAFSLNVAIGSERESGKFVEERQAPISATVVEKGSLHTDAKCFLETPIKCPSVPAIISTPRLPLLPIQSHISEDVILQILCPCIMPQGF